MAKKYQPFWNCDSRYSEKCSVKRDKELGSRQGEVESSRQAAAERVENLIQTAQAVIDRRRQFGIDSAQQEEGILDAFIRVAESVRPLTETLACSGLSTMLGRCTLRAELTISSVPVAISVRR